MSVRKVEQELDRVSALRDAPESEAAPALSKALDDRVNVIVAKAAKVAGGRGLVQLTPRLLRAFHRLFEHGSERDPQCWAKNAIAQALVDLEYRDPQPFVRGARYVQMEAVWGGRQDTATTLRSICALALPACSAISRGEVLRLLLEGLMDSAPPVRADAARALGEMGGEESALLLRLKARAIDSEPTVMGQIFDSLLALEMGDAVSFVRSFFDCPAGAVAGEATLSLGASRLPGAVDSLIAAWKEFAELDLRSAILRGLAVSRQERALDFLADLVRNGRTRDAIAALDALSVARDSDQNRRLAESAAAEREAEVQAALRSAFPTPEY
jgi:HEAT repeat protein